MTESFLKQLCANFTDSTISSLKIQSVGGGSINNTYRLLINNSSYFFLKTNKAIQYPGLFEKEKEGLTFLFNQKIIAVPKVLYCGMEGDEQLLLMEWIMPGQRTEGFWKKFGEQLALLHRCTHNQFGFGHDNYMGALRQQNEFTDSWIDFFINHRLAVQVKLAADKGLLGKNDIDLFHQLYTKLEAIFTKEPPALLHGDLWSGNFMCNDKAEPVLIDPAVYYGHRSMDLAMTTLFGGFDRDFYTAYNYHFPLPSNHDEQWEICNLYPLLIHLNLFGQSYLHDIKNIVRKYT